jgi:fatty-acid peroxygenase
MFLSLMSPASLVRLAETTERHWRSWARRWSEMGALPLFDAAHLPLCAAICEWAGIPLQEDEVEKRAGEFKAMVEGTGSVGQRNLRGHLLRARTERRMRTIIREIRAGKRAAAEGTAARAIAEHRDHDGRPLDEKVAAVELINVLRPTVANARYITFAALAMHQHPEAREALLAGDDTELEMFTHEVRRFYPFIPFIGGRVLSDFEWNNHHFREEDWVLMDIYGTNHDPAAWNDPAHFRPDRFRDRRDGAFDFIPQGGGEHGASHRCPGEWITIQQLKTVTRILAREMRYSVPAQDLTIDLGRMPALPRSRFVITEVAI